MKFTMSWLKDHLETGATLDEIAETLTMVGLEIEGVHDPAAELAPFKTAHVVSAEQHPNADKLRVCVVDTGDARVQVVCGAPNARTGMVGVFAPSGVVVPGTGLLLKPSKIRGVESNGMLVSEREMGLSDEHEGIIELPEDTPIAVPFSRIMGLDDPVLEIGVTPNRPDALGIHGIARDLAAADRGRLKDGRVEPVKGSFDCPVAVHLDLPGDLARNCPAFGLRLVRGIKNGPSPAWLQQRLRAIGLRPINILVDITNYITFDRGRPLHVFDAAKVTGDLVVRMGRDGESIEALDGKTHTVTPDMTVIADEAGLESIAGVMGGMVSGCTEETVDVLIESALWDPINIASTGRALGLESDARYRFERGVDPAFMLPGLDLATRMVLDLAGGEASHVHVAGDVPEPSSVIDFETTEIARLTGLDLPLPEVKYILKRLGFWITGSDTALKVVAPSWRPDIDEPVCLVEEVVRIAGTDRLPSTPLPRLSAVTRKVATSSQNRSRLARRALAARGLVEAVTWSFIPAGHAEAFGGGQPELKLLNPISSEMSDMRPGLLPSLIDAAQRNADRGMADLAMFEVGQAYRGIRPEDQYVSAAGVRRGTARPARGGRHWRSGSVPVDAFDAKGDALAVLAALDAPVDRLQVTADAPSWYHPGRSGVLRLGPKLVLARFGEVHPRILKALDAQGPLVAFEVFIDAVPKPRVRATRARPALDASDLMPVSRDLAFVVDSEIAAGDLIRAARGADKTLIDEVILFDIYEEETLGANKKSLAIEVVLQPRDRTLTDEEIDAVADKVVTQVAKATGGVLRT